MWDIKTHYKPYDIWCCIKSKFYLPIHYNLQTYSEIHLGFIIQTPNTMMKTITLRINLTKNSITAMEMIRIYFTIYQLLVNFLLPGILMVACYSGFVVIFKSSIQGCCILNTWAILEQACVLKYNQKFRSQMCQN